MGLGAEVDPIGERTVKARTTTTGQHRTRRELKARDSPSRHQTTQARPTNSKMPRPRVLDKTPKKQMKIDSIFPSINEGIWSKEVQRRQRVALDEEQMKVLAMVVDKGESVFFTGAAGE